MSEVLASRQTAIRQAAGACALESMTAHAYFLYPRGPLWPYVGVDQETRSLILRLPDTPENEQDLALIVEIMDRIGQRLSATGKAA